MTATTWGALFERATGFDVSKADIQRAREDLWDTAPGSRGSMEDRRAETAGDERHTGSEGRRTETDDGGGSTDEGTGATGAVARGADRSPSPARVVADSDVLAADLLVGGDARRALDALREHSWTALVASDALLDEAEAVIETLADPALAAAWRTRLEAWRTAVSHPGGDHPALASAYRGGAMHLLSFDERLTSSSAGAALSGRLPLSARHPAAFATLFDAESLYREVESGPYPGPDRDPRA